jgi:hypothetical protein
MSNPMLARSLTLVATPVLNSPRAEAHQVSFPSVLSSSEGVEDNGPDGARQIRRRLRRVLETRP